MGAAGGGGGVRGEGKGREGEGLGQEQGPMERRVVGWDGAAEVGRGAKFGEEGRGTEEYEEPSLLQAHTKF